MEEDTYELVLQNKYDAEKQLDEVYGEVGRLEGEIKKLQLQLLV